MIEVFKTNITEVKHSMLIIRELKEKFPDYKINFDLEDCDNILRIDTGNGILDNSSIIKIVGENGFEIEILADEISPTEAELQVSNI